MINSNKDYLSNSLTYVFESQIGQRVKYTANTGIGFASTANSNLDGSGSLVTILTAGGSGSVIKKITIKAIGNTTEGMIRFFTPESTNNRLLGEVFIPAHNADSVGQALMIELKVNYTVSTSLRASTQNSESFAIIAEGVDISYP